MIKDETQAVAMDQKPLYTEEIDHIIVGLCSAESAHAVILYTLYFILSAEEIDHIIVGLWEAASRDCDTQCPELTSCHTSTHSNKQTC